VAGDEVAFGQMRVARQDEGVDSRITNLAKLARHLIGVTHDCNPGSAASTPNTGPQMALDEAVCVGSVS
jgi:hypothetical protein